MPAARKPRVMQRRQRNIGVKESGGKFIAVSEHTAEQLKQPRPPSFWEDLKSGTIWFEERRAGRERRQKK